MTLFPDEPIGVVSADSRRPARIHMTEDCPHYPDNTQPTTDADLRASARMCTWCANNKDK